MKREEKVVRMLLRELNESIKKSHKPCQSDWEEGVAFAHEMFAYTLFQILLEANEIDRVE